MALHDKQARFVEEYLVDLNATAAAERAGYSDPNYGRQLLTNPNVAEAIARAREERSKRTEVTADQVVREFALMGFYDPADIASRPMTGPADIASLPEPVRRAIVGWGWDKHGNFTLKLANKQAALDSLGKHLGMFVDRIEHSGELPALVVRKESE